ncbi:MAG: hypothetical protein ACHQUC_08710 [Chlamydiales bacterium]
MKTKGIEIFVNRNGETGVGFPDILREIRNGESFYWSILFLDAWYHEAEGNSIHVFDKDINESQSGFIMKWEELESFAPKLFNLLEIVVIGCKDESLLRRYDDDQEMYETSDIAIQLIDGWYWEVFSKDEDLIDCLASKYKEINFIESDFLKDFDK